MKGFFKLLDIALANKKDYFTKPVLYCEPCNEAGLFKNGNKMVRVALGDLIQLWTNGSGWKLITPRDIYYLFKINWDTPSNKTYALAWSSKLRQIVRLYKINFRKLHQELIVAQSHFPTKD